MTKLGGSAAPATRMAVSATVRVPSAAIELPKKERRLFILLFIKFSDFIWRVRKTLCIVVINLAVYLLNLAIVGFQSGFVISRFALSLASI